MAQKKTVFERLEDKMVEMEQNVDNKLSKIQASIDKLKEEIPRSLGENLMSFTDMIGAKIEDLEDSIKNMSGSGGSSIDNSTLNTLQNGINEMKAGIKNLNSAIQNIKIDIPTPTVPTSKPTPTPQATKPITTTPVTPTPAKPAPAKPAIAPKASTTPTSTPAAPTPSGQGPMADVFKLLDSIKAKSKSSITAGQMAIEMEQTRDTIVKIFRWHPALYELATMARRLKKYPEGSALDSEMQQLLSDKIEEWKKRING